MGGKGLRGKGPSLTLTSHPTKLGGGYQPKDGLKKKKNSYSRIIKFEPPSSNLRSYARHQFHGSPKGGLTSKTN